MKQRYAIEVDNKELPEPDPGFVVEWDTAPLVVEVTQPAFKDMPEAIQQVLCLVSLGFSKAAISRLCKISPKTVAIQLERYDPDRKFQLSKQDKEAILAQMAQGKMGEAILNITQEKLEQSGAKELAVVAKQMAEVAQKMTVKETKDEYDPMELLAAMGKPKELKSAN